MTKSKCNFLTRITIKWSWEIIGPNNFEGTINARRLKKWRSQNKDLYKILTFIPLCQQGWKWRSHNKHLYKVLHFYSIVHLFETCLIQCFEQPFFNSCGLLLAPWINFSHLFIDFIHVHLHYIFRKLLGIGISLSFHPSLVYDKGIFWGECCLH